MSKTKKILEYALEIEKKGASFYKEQANNVQNQEAKKLFEKLSDFEEKHVNYIQNKLEELSKKQAIVFDPEEISEEEFIFESRKQEELDKQTKNDLPIIRMAYLIEKDFHDFYKKASQQVSEKDAKDLFIELANWEEKHLNYLYKMYQQLMQEFWFDMGFEPF